MPRARSEGGETVTGTLNVTGAVDLDSTLNVDGIATFVSAPVISSFASSIHNHQNNAGGGTLLPAVLVPTSDIDSVFGGTIQFAFPAGLRISQPTLNSAVLVLTSTATNDDPVRYYYQGRAATTDATVTTLFSLSLSNSTTYVVEATVVARRTGGSSGATDDGAGYVIRAVVKCTAGTAALIGSSVTTVIGESQAGWDAIIDVTGSTFRVRVTGAANNNVTWHATVKVDLLSS